MSSTGFEPKGSSSGRRLHIQIRYSVFYTHQDNHSCRQKNVVWYAKAPTTLFYQHTVLPTRLLILMHVKHTIPYLYVQPSALRRTPSGSKHVEDTNRSKN
jgi:hypothetical protein